MNWEVLCTPLHKLEQTQLQLIWIHRDMKIHFDKYRKRAIALQKTEQDQKFSKQFNSLQKIYIVRTCNFLPQQQSINNNNIICKTHALSKKRSSAATAKIWQTYHDSRVGVRQSWRSMVCCESPINTLLIFPSEFYF